MMYAHPKLTLKSNEVFLNFIFKCLHAEIDTAIGEKKVLKGIIPVKLVKCLAKLKSSCLKLLNINTVYISILMQRLVEEHNKVH